MQADSATALPTTERGRRAFADLRRRGFGSEYAAELVATLEARNGELWRWTAVLYGMRLEPETARAWLVRFRYLRPVARARAVN